MFGALGGLLKQRGLNGGHSVETVSMTMQTDSDNKPNDGGDGSCYSAATVQKNEVQREWHTLIAHKKGSMTQITP